MALANIHNHPEQRAKLINSSTANNRGTAHTYLTHFPPLALLGARSSSQHRRLLLTIGAEFFKRRTSSHRPRHCSHSRTAVEPISRNDISIRQRGHLRFSEPLTSGIAAAAPQRGQCLLPMNIIAKHDGQAIVARREPQYWHAGASVELAAPQFGQFSVSACMDGILAGEQGGLRVECCAMLSEQM